MILDALLATLPAHIRQAVDGQGGNSGLLEVVMDLGRPPSARYPEREARLDDNDVTRPDLDTVVHNLGEFGGDNRAGIARTLHRISCIRNRRGDIVGLTLRVGRAVYGAVQVIEDLVMSGESILLLGHPGVGKTTMLREVARVLSERDKRVIIVDTSNEIGGDGDIPHPGIGRARRMQVPTPTLQHAIMVEAVENHMPEAIIIDEIGTELEAMAARTIAERGVQLVATAHGNTLANLMMNPTLADLVGGIQTVTLSDEEARRRRTRKSILERKAPPTFSILVEIQSFTRVAVHRDVARTVDALLRGQAVFPSARELDASGAVHTIAADEHARAPEQEGEPPLAAAAAPAPHRRIYPLGLSPSRLTEAIRETGLNASIVDRPRGRRRPDDPPLPLPSPARPRARRRSPRPPHLRPQAQHRPPDGAEPARPRPRRQPARPPHHRPRRGRGRHRGDQQRPPLRHGPQPPERLHPPPPA